MNLDAITAEIVDQADEFLAGITDRAAVRAAIARLIDADYFTLPPADQKVLTENVIATLEADEFFGIEFVGDPFSDDGSEDLD